MTEIQEAKYNQCQQFKEALLNSGDAILQEDTQHPVWANGPDGSGQHKLGHILMDLRKGKSTEIQTEAKNLKISMSV